VSTGLDADADHAEPYEREERSCNVLVVEGLPTEAQIADVRALFAAVPGVVGLRLEKKPGSEAQCTGTAYLVSRSHERSSVVFLCFVLFGPCVGGQNKKSKYEFKLFDNELREGKCGPFAGGQTSNIDGYRIALCPTDNQMESFDAGII
jgi:hypothetical protein